MDDLGTYVGKNGKREDRTSASQITYNWTVEHRSSGIQFKVSKKPVTPRNQYLMVVLMSCQGVYQMVPRRDWPCKSNNDAIPMCQHRIAVLPEQFEGGCGAKWRFVLGNPSDSLSTNSCKFCTRFQIVVLQFLPNKFDYKLDALHLEQKRENRAFCHGQSILSSWQGPH